MNRELKFIILITCNLLLLILGNALVWFVMPLWLAIVLQIAFLGMEIFHVSLIIFSIKDYLVMEGLINDK